MPTRNLTVLHVEAGKHFYGGALQVVHIIEGLRRRGIDNVLACPIGSEIAHAAAPFAEIVEMPMKGDADIGMAFRLSRLMRRLDPDVVHLHSRRGADLWGGVAASMAGVPCVLSRRVDNPEPPTLVALKYPLFDQIITISDGIRDILMNEGVPDHKVSTVRSAIDASDWTTTVDRSAFLAEFGLPEDALTIGMVAQLIRRKGHRHLLDALPSVLGELPNVHVLMFGQGPMEAELRASIGARGLEHRVRLVGFRRDLARWIGGLDVLAHPADMEGLGIALLQAAAAGVPVVASRVGGLPEAVKDGVTGLLTRPGDPVHVGWALRTLLGDEVMRDRMGRAGRKRMELEFSIDAMVDGNLAVYQDCILNWEIKRAGGLTAHHS